VCIAWMMTTNHARDSTRHIYPYARSRDTLRRGTISGSCQPSMSKEFEIYSIKKSLGLLQGHSQTFAFLKVKLVAVSGGKHTHVFELLLIEVIILLKVHVFLAQLLVCKEILVRVVEVVAAVLFLEIQATAMRFTTNLFVDSVKGLGVLFSLLKDVKLDDFSPEKAEATDHEGHLNESPDSVKRHVDV